MNTEDQGVEVKARVTPPGSSAACEFMSIADACRDAHKQCEFAKAPPLVEMKVGDGEWFPVRLSNFV
jgi:hypothetical protein